MIASSVVSTRIGHLTVVCFSQSLWLTRASCEWARFHHVVSSQTHSTMHCLLSFTIVIEFPVLRRIPVSLFLIRVFATPWYLTLIRSYCGHHLASSPTFVDTASSILWYNWTWYLSRLLQQCIGILSDLQEMRILFVTPEHPFCALSIDW